MYESHWGLSESPFRNQLDERWFFAGSLHDEALARLQFVIEQQRRCAVLTGGAGTGKSLLLHTLGRQLRRTQRQSALCDLNGLGADEFLSACAAALHADCGPSPADPRGWRSLEDHLAVLRLAQIPTVLLLDQFDRAGRDVLPAVRRLMDAAQGASCWLTVIVAARSLDSPPHRAVVAEAADLLVEVGPWTRRETTAYIRQTLAEAGAQADLFTAAALRAVFDETGGVPRAVNRLCDLSLLAAMGQDVRTVDAETVHAAAAELQVPDHAPKHSRTAPALGRR